MKHAVTTDDILHSIEFELAQSAITQTELGDGLNAVRQFQNKARTATFESDQALRDMRSLIVQQYQINDMHLTLLQEIVATVQTMQLDMRRLGQLPPREAAVSSVAPAVPEHPLTSLAGQSLPADWSTDELMPAWSDDLLENAMKPDALKLKIDVRSSSLPIVGGWLRRVRAAFHNLTLFYLQQFGQKQTVVNQVYGERLLQLSQLVQQQQQQIEALRAQVMALAALAALAGQAPHS